MSITRTKVPISSASRSFSLSGNQVTSTSTASAASGLAIDSGKDSKDETNDYIDVTSKDAPNLSAPSGGAGAVYGKLDTKIKDFVFGLEGKIPMPKPLPMKEFKMSQSLFTPGFDAAGTSHGNSWSFVIGTLPQYNALIALFDVVKVEKVHWCLQPAYTAQFGTGKYFVAIDYDDGTVPISLNQVQSYENVICVPGTCGVIRDFVPAVASSTWSGGFAAAQRCWVNLDYGGTTFYGVKVWFATSAGAFAYDLFVQVDMTFKCVR